MPRRPRLAFTLGDPNGIGPEVVLKATAEEGLRARAEIVVVGSEAILRQHAQALGLTAALAGLVVEEVDAQADSMPQWGRVTISGGAHAMAAVARACDLCIAGEVNAMVTAPISKEAIHLSGHAFPGHTEFLAERTHADGFVMLMAAEELRVAVVTTHIPLHAVAHHVTVDAVLNTLLQLNVGLRTDFGIDRPRIALLGLNPHAGDGGVIGTEEIEVLEPAMARAQELDVQVEGPFPADGFFGRRADRRFDAVVACYHDQGLIPFKTLAMGGGVNVTLGLPIVRTSPDHGTGFDIAGQGRADPASFVAAAHLAADIATRRQHASAD